jgi:cytochrome c553
MVLRPVIAAVALALAGCGGAAPQSAAVQFQRTAEAAVAEGERLAKVLGCIGCHQADLTGEDWSEPGFGRLWTSNLGRALPRYSDKELAQTIRRGARPNGAALWEMPSHLFSQLSDEDMAVLIAFLRSKPPAGEPRPLPLFEEGARREMAAGSFRSSKAQVQTEGAQWPPDMGEGHALGRYIVRATCAECHGLDLRGGQPNPEAQVRPDLRMVASYEPGDFRGLLRTGVAAGNREVGMMSDVARGRYAHFTDGELEAVYRYLQAVGRAE